MAYGKSQIIHFKIQRQRNIQEHGNIPVAIQKTIQQEKAKKVKEEETNKSKEKQCSMGKALLNG